MSQRRLDNFSTDALLYELLLLTRREQWLADPLRFGQEVLTHHLSRAPASFHRRMMGAVGALAGVGESEGNIYVSLPSAPLPSADHSEPVHIANNG